WRGPVVLNISVGATTGGTPPEVASALSAAYARGLAVAVAAGDQPGASGYASMTRQAMVVGALGETGGVASYSPTGGVNVFAAGGESLGGTNVGTGVISTYSAGQYAWLTGTSMATPLVAAALALLMSTGLTNQQAYDRIQGTEDPAGGLRADRALGRSGGCGAGAPVRAAPRPLPPVTATAPAPAGASVQTAPPVTGPAATAAAPMLPSTSTVPYDETTHLHRAVTDAPLAGTAGSPRTGLRGLLATSAGARTDAGLVALAAAAGFAAAYVSSRMLWRRLRRIRAGTR
ncbi:MAG TPA: S8 family serine peptidase, partial [Candidatus Dormibacteraeota bacterium]